MPVTLVGRRGCCCVNFLWFTDLSSENAFPAQAAELEGAPPRRMYMTGSDNLPRSQALKSSVALQIGNRSAYAIVTAAKATLQRGLLGG